MKPRRCSSKPPHASCKHRTYLVYAYSIGVPQGEKEQMDRAVAQAKGKRAAEHRVANSQALVAARSGQLQQAHQLSSRAVNLARQERNREAAATYQAVEAVWDALYGNASDARKNATAALGFPTAGMSNTPRPLPLASPAMLLDPKR